MSKESRTHSLIYYVKESGSYITTTPRLWAHANSHHFRTQNPRTKAIGEYLIENFRFKYHSTDDTFVIYNFDIKIPTGINGKSFYKNSN